jgi:hypothetical protein
MAGEKYNFYKQNKNFTKISDYESQKYFNLVSPHWNNCEFVTDNYSIVNYNFDWYNITSYIFSEENVIINKLFKVGKTYENIINEAGKPDLELNNGFGLIILKYGEPVYGIYNRTISKIELFLNNNIIYEIHYNIVDINITENIEQIIINPWKSYPTHEPQWYFDIKKDNVFTFHSKINIEDNYNIINGIWHIKYNKSLPIIAIEFENNENLNMDYKVYKIRDNSYCILFNGKYYFYPYIPIE